MHPRDDHWALSSCDRSFQSDCVVQRCKGNRRGNHVQAAILERAYDCLPARTISPRSVDQDRKSTRLNSSHTVISYAVFCLKKKKHTHTQKNCTHPLSTS